MAGARASPALTHPMNLLEAIELHLPAGYTIEGQLGRGGTSSAYLAARAGSPERLVVKVMLPGKVTAATIDQFFHEMQVLKKLQHPRIVPLLEPGEANGAVFFTMPYIPGETLHARLQAQGRLATRDALLIARDVADALGHAHTNGVVHRDVKPANILLAADGAYLMDFGFAHAGGGQVGAEKGQRFIVGTPDYMSPEQVSGRQENDWRGDFFSLGCVMYEMLTGRLPFEGGTARATMQRRITETAPDVRVLRPDVPESVAAIVRRNLDPRPTGRYVAAGSLRAALDAALAELDAAG